MANLRASPTGKALVVDRDQDITHEVTIPMGTYLPCSSWAMSYIVTHPVTGATVFDYTTAAGEITVTTAGSSVADGKVLVTYNDEDIDDIDKRLTYNWKLKRTDAANEINIDAGTITFLR